jgi:hypothetical protein
LAVPCSSLFYPQQRDFSVAELTITVDHKA